MFLKEIFFWWHSKGLSSHSKETLMGDGTELYAGLSLSHFYIKDISVSEHTFYFMFLSTPPALIEHVCFCHLHLSNQLHIQQFGLRSSFVPECSLIYTKYFSYTSDFLLKCEYATLKKWILKYNEVSSCGTKPQLLTENTLQQQTVAAKSPDVK